MFGDALYRDANVRQAANRLAMNIGGLSDEIILMQAGVMLSFQLEEDELNGEAE